MSYFQSMERCIGVERGLEQISDVSLLTNQAIKSYLFIL